MTHCTAPHSKRSTHAQKNHTAHAQMAFTDNKFQKHTHLCSGAGTSELNKIFTALVFEQKGSSGREKL
jgi:hypothetical protein